MNLVALVLYALGLSLAFGLRSGVQWRRTGSTGFRGISGQPGSAEWWGGVLFVLALVLGAAAPVLAVVGVLAPPPSTMRSVIGLIIITVGLVVTLAAQSSMGTSWRIGVDENELTELVESGLFRWVRNPIFTGMLTVALGAAVMIPTVLALASLVALLVAVQIQVRVVEEPYLERIHGTTYTAYVAQTSRVLPSPRRRATWN